MPITPFPPTLDRIAQARDTIASALIKTPTLKLDHAPFTKRLGTGATMKLELFQHAGSFKARGAYLAIQALNQAEKDAGVVAVSAGNHAIATAWASQASGVKAKVCLPKTADPFRVSMCEALGATVIQCDDIATAFAECDRLVTDEGRTLLHPFESPYMALGAATCAAEFLDAVPDLEVAVIPVGGGGLIAGMSAALKQLKPSIKVYGVEPTGAMGVSDSLAAGKPLNVSVNTIADSLGAPMAMPFSFELIQQYVDEVVTVSDDDLRSGMSMLAETLNLMPEPACVASMIGAMGPLNDKCRGEQLGLLACGSNISVEKWQSLLSG